MDPTKYGPWALVVGSSEGVGESFARKLAADGFNLVMTSRRAESLEPLAKELRSFGRDVRTLSLDLTEADALARAQAATDGLEVGLLVYVAGVVTTHGDFVRQDPDLHRRLVAINVTGQTDFTHHYGAAMCDRGRGGMIIVGSMGSFIGSPNLSVYCGVKAFSRIFCEGLWLECQKHGVDVLHMCLGFTATPAMRRIGLDVSMAASPDAVAQEALDNIANGPVLLSGGEPTRARAISYSQVDNRAEAVRASVIQLTASEEA
jgi:short-subunit dehydrogenase